MKVFIELWNPEKEKAANYAAFLMVSTKMSLSDRNISVGAGRNESDRFLSADNARLPPDQIQNTPQHPQFRATRWY